MISPSEKRYKSVLAGVSMIGLKHIREDSCSQDALLYREYSFGTIIAVGDGVGSEAFSQYGSDAVVKGVHSAFISLANNQIKSEQIAETIVSEYRDGVPDEYKHQAATTCIYAAHIYGLGVYLGQVGDGICCGIINGKEFILQKKEDDFTNVVMPLSINRNISQWTESFIPEDSIEDLQIMIATDGISEDILPGKECAFTEFILHHLSELESSQRENYLRHLLQEWATPKSIDDKTFCFYSIKKVEE